MTATKDLLDLAKHLKKEKLFVSSEKQQLQRLNQEVTKTAENLYHLSWITRQQRQNLEKLILGSWDMSPAACCYRANALERVSFVDAYKHVSYHDTVYGEFLKMLRENPQLLGHCLLQENSVEDTQNIAKVVMSAVYGNCVMQEDERHVLLLLQALVENELAGNDDPRRLLRRGSCVFSMVFKQFTEGLYSGRLYLTAALHEPLMALLMEDECYLETNPHKVVDNFTQQEQEKLFGSRGSPEYQQNVRQHLESNISRLVQHCNKFIQSLKDSMYCFPQSLDWIVSQIYKITTRTGKIKPEEVRAMCIDMLLLLFICPAIVNPEQYGIVSDILISEIARFNLMQVAQILQALSMKMYSTTDSRSNDIYSRFPKDCMSSFVDVMIDSLGSEDIPPTSQQLEGTTRSAALITQRELYALVAYLRSVQTSNPNHPESKDVETILSTLPPTPPNACMSSPSQGSTPSTPSPTPPDTPVNPVKKNHGKGRKSIKSGVPTLSEIENQAETSTNSSSNHLSAPPAIVQEPEEVLVIPLGNTANECPGLLSETKVLESAETKTKTKTLERGNRASPSLHAEMPEKQLRFSADASAVSDNLESMSIGASNSVYSMDLENISNTSGLENISSCASGRNTPRSTASSGDAARALEMLESEPHDISDRFGKFEIQPLEKEKSQMDAVETWSETWSTDVLASDQSEPPPEHNPMERLQEIAEAQSEQVDYPGAQGLLEVRHPGELSETASETWSVDVLQSDSEHPEERLHELEETQDDSTLEGDLLDDKANEHERNREDDQYFDAIDNSTRALESIRPSDVLDSMGAVGGVGNLFGERPHHAIPRVVPPTTERGKHADELTHRFINLETGRKGGATAHEQDGLLDSFDPFAPSGNAFPSSSGGGDGTLLASRSQRDSGIGTSNSMSPSTPENVSGNLAQSPNRRSNPFYGEHASGHSHGHPEMQSNTKSNEASDSLLPDAFPSSVESGGCGDESRTSSLASSSSNSSGAGTNRSVEIPLESNMIVNGGKSVSNDGAVNVAGIDPRQDGGESPDKGNKSWWKKKLPFKVPSRKGKGGKADKDKEQSSLFQHLSFNMHHSESAHHNHHPHHQPSHQGDNEMAKSLPTALSAPNSDDIMTKYKNLSIMGQAVDVQDPEDILNKYRHKLHSGLSSSAPMENALVNFGSTSDNNDVPNGHGDHPDSAADNMLITGENIESTYAFSDAKRKLRIVLCSADFHTLPWLTNFSTSVVTPHRCNFNECGSAKESHENEMIAFLKVQLAEAINLQDKSLIAQLHETLRCVRQFDVQGCKKLLQSLREDYLSRAPYIAYLIRCRKGLLATQAHLERLLERVERDKMVCNKYFTSLCVRQFLERQEHAIHRFIIGFQALTVSDEKTDHVEEFLQHLYNWISQDPIWQAATEDQILDAQVATERAIMSRIYKQALYPNGDGDIMRDQVLHEHIKRLSRVVTASHRALQVAEKYRKEAPWPSAQAELLTINVYKTPKDKLQCVIRCCSTIMNLLSMANDNSVPGADDFVPVLVFVLIKANPPGLLSTIQYVNSFYEKRLNGEEQYWWMQFSAAVEFIKTIDERK
ncbi:GTPase-activating protein and VPS9 domain-containing protein 1-like [Saccoglossus kowalevskii]|uniref:GTPase-activating protein and VPS9 domain-containing protein 1-like n=1 Tax=Saccoglossus kowalevskii TaxID=10224 RepID=A0ABM0GR34_SACKO|nr:PREDICTED: GTPase-activating protein and VPS9 domain-containing protein 1-like [Saccoglossus kowalevskii]